MTSDDQNFCTPIDQGTCRSDRLAGELLCRCGRNGTGFFIFCPIVSQSVPSCRAIHGYLQPGCWRLGSSWDGIFYIPSQSVPKCPILSRDSRVLAAGMLAPWQFVGRDFLYSVPKRPKASHLVARFTGTCSRDAGALAVRGTGFLIFCPIVSQSVPSWVLLSQGGSRSYGPDSIPD